MKEYIILPNDMVKEIFSWLDTLLSRRAAMLVCKQWHICVYQVKYKLKLIYPYATGIMTFNGEKRIASGSRHHGPITYTSMEPYNKCRLTNFVANIKERKFDTPWIFIDRALYLGKTWTYHYFTYLIFRDPESTLEYRFDATISWPYLEMRMTRSGDDNPIVSYEQKFDWIDKYRLVSYACQMVEEHLDIQNYDTRRRWSKWMASFNEQIPFQLYGWMLKNFKSKLCFAPQLSPINPWEKV